MPFDSGCRARVRRWGGASQSEAEMRQRESTKEPTPRHSCDTTRRKLKHLLPHVHGDTLPGCEVKKVRDKLRCIVANGRTMTPPRVTRHPWKSGVWSVPENSRHSRHSRRHGHLAQLEKMCGAHGGAVGREVWSTALVEAKRKPPRALTGRVQRAALSGAG